jgi:hypothetical protein
MQPVDDLDVYPVTPADGSDLPSGQIGGTLGTRPTTKVCIGFIPAAFYARLRTVQNTGSPTFLYRAGQEVLLF